MTETSEPGLVPVLALRGLRRNYGRIEAVAGVDLRVGAGETLALLGPNGAGKSTTLAMVLGPRLMLPRPGTAKRNVDVRVRAPRTAGFGGAPVSRHDLAVTFTHLLYAAFSLESVTDEARWRAAT